MAKRSHKRPVKDQAGCMWGLICMFHFRHNRAPQRLLSDRRRDSKHTGGATHTRTDVNAIKDFEDKFQIAEVGEENLSAKAGAIKTSVKELIEEEMISVENSDKQIRYIGTEKRFTNSKDGGHVRKKYKHTNRTKKKPPDMCTCGMDTAINIGTESPSYQVAKQQTSNNLDLDTLVETLCHQIYLKAANCSKDDSRNDFDRHSNRANSVLKEKLSAAVEMLADQRFSNMEDGGELRSKELMHALEPLMINEDLLFKLVHDPDSPFTKHIEDFKDAEFEHCSKCKTQVESNLLERDLSRSKLEEIISSKNYNLFSRKGKSQESFHLEGNAISDSGRIATLKPGPGTSQHSDHNFSVSKPLQSHYTKQSKTRSDRNAFLFSFSEIKRRLKHAMGKEQYVVQSNNIPRRFPHEHPRLNDGENHASTETGGWYSPNRNHFYIEKYAKSSFSIKRREKIDNFISSDIGFVDESNRYQKHENSNIYAEAKKHISEMFSNGDEEEFISGKLRGRTLGRILSYPGYNLSSNSSFAKGRRSSSATSQVRLSHCENTRMPNKDDDPHATKEIRIIQGSPSGKILESHSGTDIKGITENLETPDSNHNLSCHLIHDPPAAEIPSSGGGIIGSEGVSEITSIANCGSEEERKFQDISCELSSSCVAEDIQNKDSDLICDVEKFSFSFESNSIETNPSSSCSIASPSTPSTTRKVEGPDTVTDRKEKASPISVLEPFLFIEDDISPTRTKAHRVEVRPLKIHFDERSHLAGDQGGFVAGTCMEDEGSVFEYVEALLLGSDLNWDEFLLRWISLEQPLHPSVFDEVDLLTDEPLHYRNLLFDCTNEVLSEVCECYFGVFPGVFYVRKQIQPVPRGMDLINEVWKGVERHLLQRPQTTALNKLIQKDTAKFGTWTELQSDVEYIGKEMEKVILDELMEDTIVSLATNH